MAIQHCGHCAARPCMSVPYSIIKCVVTTQHAVRSVEARPMEQRWKAMCREDRRADKLVVRASDSSNTSGSSSRQRPEAAESILGESDSAFFLKLLFVSFAGAAAVKYGSLLLDTPFQPNLAVGLSIIAAPCVAFAVYLGSRSR